MKGPHSPMAASHGTVVKVKLLPLWGHGTRRDRAKGHRSGATTQHRGSLKTPVAGTTPAS